MSVPAGRYVRAHEQLPVGTAVRLLNPSYYHLEHKFAQLFARVERYVATAYDSTAFYVVLRYPNGRKAGVYPNHIAPVTPADDMTELAG